MLKPSPQTLLETHSGKLAVMDGNGTTVGYAFTEGEVRHLLRDTYTIGEPDKLDMAIVSVLRVPIETSDGVVEVF